MTREEAISLLSQVNHILVNSNSWLENTHEPLNIAFDMAIKALEQESAIDKIRAEIEDLTYYCCEVHPRTVIDDVLKIIDKYRESEEYND